MQHHWLLLVVVVLPVVAAAADAAWHVATTATTGIAHGCPKAWRCVRPICCCV